MYSLQAPLWIKLRVTLFKVKVFTFERVPPDVNCYVSVIRSDLMDSVNEKRHIIMRYAMARTKNATSDIQQSGVVNLSDNEESIRCIKELL